MQMISRLKLVYSIKDDEIGEIFSSNKIYTLLNSKKRILLNGNSIEILQIDDQEEECNKEFSRLKLVCSIKDNKIKKIFSYNKI